MYVGTVDEESLDTLLEGVNDLSPCFEGKIRCYVRGHRN